MRVRYGCPASDWPFTRRFSVRVTWRPGLKKLYARARFGRFGYQLHGGWWNGPTLGFDRWRIVR